jgi:ABC-type transport system substrate-binding protein
MSAAGYANGRGIAYDVMVRAATGINMENATRFHGDMRTVFPEMQITLSPKASSADFAVPQAEGRFDQLSYTITAVPDAALELHSQYHTSGSRNYGKFSDPELDGLIDNAVTELDVDVRTELLDKAQQRFMDTMPMLVLYTQPRKTMVQGDIGGFDQTFGIWLGYGMTTKVHRWFYVDK